MKYWNTAKAWCKKKFTFQDYKESQERFKASEKYQAYAERLKGLLYHHYNKELEKKIETDSRFSTIQVGSSADYHARQYARIVSRRNGRSLEVSLAMIADKGSMVVKDMEPYHDQRVTSASCKDSPSGKSKTYDEVKARGECIVGWAHSHGQFSLHYSAIDQIRFDQDAFLGSKLEVVLAENFSLPVRVFPALLYNETMKEKDSAVGAITLAYVRLGERVFTQRTRSARVRIVPQKDVLHHKSLEAIVKRRVIAA